MDLMLFAVLTRRRNRSDRYSYQPFAVPYRNRRIKHQGCARPPRSQQTESSRPELLVLAYGKTIVADLATA